MFTFVMQKILHKKWMIISLLIGNILLISITCCNPMYMKAALQKTLTSTLSDYYEENDTYPGMVTSTLYFTKGIGNNITSPVFMDYDLIDDNIISEIDIPLLHNITFYSTKHRNVTPELERDTPRSNTAGLSFISGIEDHAKIVMGRMYSPTPDSDGVIECIISEKTMIQMGLLLDEIVTMDDMIDNNGNPYRFKIVGVFEAASSNDVYWSACTPSGYGRVFVMDKNVFMENIYYGENIHCMFNCKWNLIFDYTQITVNQTDELLERAAYLTAEAETNKTTTFEANFVTPLSLFAPTAAKISVSMWILQVPIFVLLAAFIFMVAKQMLDMEQNEIAMLKSRGVSKMQIVFVYFLQSLILALVSYVVSIPLAYLICKVIGSTNTFMEFVARKALVIEINETVLLYGLIAAGVSILFMTLPSFAHAGVTIVEHKRKLQRKDKPFWQKMFLDVILFAISLYGYYNFNKQSELLETMVQSGESLDPLLFLNSSLFIISAGLLSLRILPLITWLVYQLGRFFWSPALYASFLHIIRTKRKQGFICVFIIFTIAMGIFNANTARTININVENSIRHETGADIVLKEKWKDNSYLFEDYPDLELVYYEPDYSKYTDCEDIASVTKVFRDNYVRVSINQQSSQGTQSSSSRNIRGCQLLAIDTKEFGETACMKEDVLPAHFYEYLNLISQNPQAVILSQSFADTFGLQVGDVIYYTCNGSQSSCIGTVYAFVDEWPGFVSSYTAVGEDGVTYEYLSYLVVSHYSQVINTIGNKPYEVWIKTNGSSHFIYDLADEHEISFTKFLDTDALLTEARNQSVYQLTNGLLTINFIVVLTLCTVGFLIYWILSIKSRELLFGVYRAMGMSMREVITMLINEHLFISFLSVAIGAVIGIIASKLFIPLIEIAYKLENQTLPVEIASSTEDMISIGGTVGVVFVGCLIILGILISRTKISQALKLGEE